MFIIMFYILIMLPISSYWKKKAIRELVAMFKISMKLKNIHFLNRSIGMIY